MDIAIHASMPTRPCRLCLCLQGGSVFADFDADPDGRLFAVRVSFDGFGCCHTPADIGRMNERDSHALLSSLERGEVSKEAEKALRTYFGENAAFLWSDALEHHDLI
jgi:hypothetical protein